MSLFGLFDIGKSSLLASQTALMVTSNNIANVNTPGFSRQGVILSIASPVSGKGGYLGTGVVVSGTKRHYDSFIQSQLIGQYQNYGRSYALDNTFSQVEMVFNETIEIGLSASLTNYFNAWHDVAANPEGETERTVLLQEAEALVSRAKSMESGILDTLKQTNQQIDGMADRINSIASDIASLNEQIVQVETGADSESAYALRDQRDNLLNELSTLVEFTSYEDTDGSITVMVGMRNLVSGGMTNSLSTNVNEDGNNDLYLDGINITDRVNGGQIGGLIAARDDIESGSLYDLRKLIASVTKEINMLHTSGYGLDGSTGNDFFNPLQLVSRDFSSGADISSSITDLSALTLDEYEITFDASNNYYVTNRQTGSVVTSGAYVSGNVIAFDGIEVVITGVVTPADKFSVSPLSDAIGNFGVAITDTQKIAAAASDTDLPGDNTNALNIANLSDASIANLGNTNFMDYYSGLVSEVAGMSRAASDSLQFDDNLLYELSMRREAISGVSLDEEALNLIRFQRSFEAGARLIEVTDELLQTIINL